MHRRRVLFAVCCLAACVASAQEASRRVEREASNPMRLIIEAAKIKPKARPAEATASAPAPAPARAARPASTPVPAEVALEVLPPSPPGTSRSSVATVDVEAELTPLKLREQVEPVIPRELRALIEGEVQLLVGFTVLPDGRVAEAAVRRSSHPEVNAVVLDAVRQWRYQPIAAATPHEVELVLRPGD